MLYLFLKKKLKQMENESIAGRNRTLSYVLML